MANGIDTAEAIGKAAACISLQSALIAALITKKVLSREDAATLTGVANVAVGSMEGLSDDARALAQDVLKGFAKSWLKPVTRN